MCGFLPDLLELLKIGLTLGSFLKYNGRGPSRYENFKEFYHWRRQADRRRAILPLAQDEARSI